MLKQDTVNDGGSRAIWDAIPTSGTGRARVKTYTNSERAALFFSIVFCPDRVLVPRSPRTISWRRDLQSHRDLYERISHSGRLILQIHAWDEADHPNLVNSDAAPPGHGVLLWFQVDDFDAVVERARGLGAEIIEEPHINPAPQHSEMWVRDSNGYVVVVASPDGVFGS